MRARLKWQLVVIVVIILLTAGSLGLTSPSAKATSCSTYSHEWYLSPSYVYFQIQVSNWPCNNGTAIASGWINNCGGSQENVNVDVLADKASVFRWNPLR